MTATKLVNGQRVELTAQDISAIEAKEKQYIDELPSKITSHIKQEAKRRITELYSDVKQRNIIMSQLEADITVMNTAIKAIRDKSNDLEASLSSMTIEQLKAFDPTADSNWQ